MAKPQVMVTGAIAKFTVLGVPDRPGIAADVFERIGQAGHSVSMMSTVGGVGGRTDFSFIVDSDVADSISGLLESLKSEIDANGIERRDDVVEVSLHGPDLAGSPGVAGRMFRVLSDSGVNIDMMSTGVSSVACIIDAKDGDKAKAALEKAFAE